MLHCQMNIFLISLLNKTTDEMMMITFLSDRSDEDHDYDDGDDVKRR